MQRGGDLGWLMSPACQSRLGGGGGLRREWLGTGCGALRAGQGNLPEAGKTVRLGSGPGPAGGREYKSPIVLGLLSRGPRQAGVSKGVCECVHVFGAGLETRGVKGSEGSWLSTWSHPLSCRSELWEQPHLQAPATVVASCAVRAFSP